MSITRGMVKQNILYTYGGILFDKKERDIGEC